MNTQGDEGADDEGTSDEGASPHARAQTHERPADPEINGAFGRRTA